jgi:hypothetical protein
MSSNLLAPWCRVHLQKQIFREKPIFCGTPTSISVPSRAQQWYLSEPNEAIQHAVIQTLRYIIQHAVTQTLHYIIQHAVTQTLHYIIQHAVIQTLCYIILSVYTLILNVDSLLQAFSPEILMYLP